MSKMSFSSFVATLVIVANAAWPSVEGDAGVSLLQHLAMHQYTRHGRHNATRSQDPAKRERKMCPHEIDEQKHGKTPFGCRGKLYAASTKECSWWGEPHVSATFPSQREFLKDKNGREQYDLMYKVGLFRMAKAKDDAWEVQAFNCGAYSSAVAARFGKDVVEFIATESGTDMYLNGQLQTSDFPIENQNGLFMDNSHRVSLGDGVDGACIDDGSSGQIYVEVNSGTKRNLNVLLRAATDSYSTEEDFSFCNVELEKVSEAMGGHIERLYTNWPIRQVDPSDSLFTVGNKSCAMCLSAVPSWGKYWDHYDKAKAVCDVMAPKDVGMMNLKQMCKAHSITIPDAKAACVHLQNNPEFFNDCQFDYCASGGDPAAAAEAEGELAKEHPQPKCVKEGVGCDPAKVCCDALKSKHTLDFSSVGHNNLCGVGEGPVELRFRQAGEASDGSRVDLVIKPTGEFNCSNGVTNKKNGVSGNFGALTIPVGCEAEFSFNFVKTGTDDPAALGSTSFSFLDLDQGKKGKQRESVEVCGATNAVVTTDSELEQSTSNNCIKMVSSTRGNDDDNPDDPENLSDSARARTVAFQVSGSSFKATLGVSKKGRQARKFLFSGHPTIACAVN